jgi:hypothetical protein
MKLSGIWFDPPDGYRGILLKILAFYNFVGPFFAAVTGFYCFTLFDIDRVIDIMGALSPTIETNVRFLSFYFRKRELEDMIKKLFKLAKQGSYFFNLNRSLLCISVSEKSVHSDKIPRISIRLD